jgi:hypothetical protein
MDNTEGSDISSSSSSEDEDSSSISIEEYQSSADDKENREDYEISDDEDERNAMAVIHAAPPSVPPAYERVSHDPNIDPALQIQPASGPPKKARKKKSKSKGHGTHYSLLLCMF